MADIVYGGKDGLVVDNTFNTKSEPLVTVEKLKGAYLFGLNIKNPNTGKEIPSDVSQSRSVVDSIIFVLNVSYDRSD